MTRKALFCSFILFCIICFFAVNRVISKDISSVILKADVNMDPYGKQPLSAFIELKTNKPAKISLTIKGRDSAQDLTHVFFEYKTKHTIPVLGLYANYNNEVIITAYFDDKTVQQKTIFIPTKKMIRRALFVVQEKNDNKARYHFITDGLVFDEYGNLRFSFENDGNIVYSMNGELISENRIGGLIRYSLMGEEKQKYVYPKGFTSFTHGIGQKPNGNFLVIGSFAGATVLNEGVNVASHRDFVIEIDYKTGKMLNKIDLAEILNPHRDVIVPKNYIDYGLNDWCHINGVDYDASDSGIVISCRHSGIIKVNEKTKELV